MEWRASTVSVLLLALTGIQVNSTMVYPSNHVNSICSMWGDFHFKTFDGDVYQFPGMCEYNLVSDCQSLIHQFSVHVKRTENSTGPKISRVLITINDIGVELTEKQVLVNEEKVKLPVQHAGILVEENTIYTRLYSKMGITVKWNKNDAVMVELDSKYSNRTCGLCGDFNGVPVYNEFIDSGRRIGYVEFGNKHRVRNPMHACEDPFENVDEKNVVNKCEKVQTDCADLLKDEKWSSCRWVLNPEPYIKACTNDICSRQTKDKDSKTSAICASLSEYSRLCSHAGGAPPNWRTAAFCAVTCPYNMVHSESGSPCMDTCSHQNTNSLCEEHNTDGCFCPPGTVFDDISNKGCIPSERCKCKHDHIYNTGEILHKDEGECVCEEGEWVCTSIPRPGLCSLEEGSHFTTFDGKEFTFNGDCHYVLSKDCNQTKFSILGEIAPCYTRQTDTCLKSVVVLFYNDIKNPLIIKADGSVQHNADILLPYITADFTVFMPSSFHVMLQTTFGLQVQIQLVPLMQVYITVDQNLQGKTCGLCGNFNKVLSDDLKTPQGVVEGTPVSFANSWKSSFNCPDRTERMDDPCSYSSDSENFAQHWCSKMQDKESLFAKCHTTVNPESYYKRCKYSSCSCEKSEDCLCAVVSSYVRACAAKGISLQGWRKIVCEKYTKNCPASQNYSYQLQTCQRTCLSLASERQSCSVDFVPVDGCACPDGLYQDENGLCVPSEKCPCFHTGQKINPGKSITVRDEHCICIKGKLHCHSWKNQTQVCSSPKVFFNCSTAAPDEYGLECAKTCSQQKVDCFSEHCQSGCQCPSGLLDDGIGHCVKPDNCPCKHNGQFYKQGSTITTDCNKCTCQGGKWKCTHYKCPGICTIYGSGHYRTFDQQRFGFSGGCSYIAAQNNCGNKTGNFYVITENMPCGTTGTTCSKAVKILLGRTMLLLSGGTVTATDTKSGPEIRYTERNFGMYLVIDANIGLTILWDRKTTVRIILQPQHMDNVCGLCGNFNGDAKDDFTTQGNLPTTNAMEFVDSWKVLSSCPDAKPDFNPCVETPNRENWAKIQCSIIKDIKGPFKACHNKVDQNPYYDNCVKDSCACDTGGDCECLCTAVAAYAQACNEADVCVNWRTPEICPVYCDYYNTGTDDCTWHYSPCHTSCYKTCLNPNATCDNNLPNLEGCYPKCPEDKPIFDEKNRICVEECILTTTPKPSTSSFPTPTTTTKPTTTTPEPTTPSSPITTTITFTSTSTKSTTSCIICGWSDWFNVYNPDLGGGNDLETYKNIAEHGKEICKEPKGVECRSVKNSNMSFEDFINKSKQVAQCNVSYGLECKKDQQKDRPFKCFDYEIRVYCCIPCSPTTTPTATTKSSTTTPKHTTPSSPTPTTTTKSTTTTPKPTTPSSPTSTTTTKSSTKPIHTTPSTPTPTVTTKTTTTPKHTTPSSPTPTTTTMSTTTTEKPTTPSTHTATPKPSTSSFPTPTTTTKPTTTTPEPTTPSSPITTTITFTSTSTKSTTSCIICGWSDWFNVYNPDLGGGNDLETYKNIAEHGKEICKEPKGVECRSVKNSNMSFEDFINKSKQVAQCNVSYGLECKKDQQKDRPFKCFDYEIRVYCCIPCSPTTTPTATTKSSTTTPKHTTPSSPTPTTTTKSTTTTPKPTTPSSPTSTTTTKSSTKPIHTTPSTPTPTVTTKTTTTPKHTTPSSPTPTTTTMSTTTPKATTPSTPTSTATTESIATTSKYTTSSSPTPTTTTKYTTTTPKHTTASSPTPTATTKSTSTTIQSSAAQTTKSITTPTATAPSTPTSTITTKSTTTTTTSKPTTPSTPTSTATTKSTTTTTSKSTTPSSPTATATTKSTTTTPKHTTPSSPTPTVTTKSTSTTIPSSAAQTTKSIITPTATTPSTPTSTITTKSTTTTTTSRPTTPSTSTSTATTKSTTTLIPTTPSTPTPTATTKTTTTPKHTTPNSPTPTTTTKSSTTPKLTTPTSPKLTTTTKSTTPKLTTPSSPTPTATTKSTTTPKHTTPTSPTPTTTTKSTTTPKLTTPSTPTQTASTKSTTTTPKPTTPSSPIPTTTPKPTTPSTPTPTPTTKTTSTTIPSSAAQTTKSITTQTATTPSTPTSTITTKSTTTTTPKPTTPSTPTSTATTKSITTTPKLTTPTSPTAITTTKSTTPKLTTPSSPTTTATTKSTTTTPKHTTPSSPTPTTTTKSTSTTIPSSPAQTTRSITTQTATTPSTPTSTITTKSTTTTTSKPTTPSTPTSTATTKSTTTSKSTTPSSPTATATTKSTTTTPKHTTTSSPTPTVTTKSTSTTIPSSAAQTTKSIITPTATTPSTPTSTITTKSTTTTSRPTTPSTSTSTTTTKSTTTLIPTTPSTPTPTATKKTTTTPKHTTPNSPTPTTTTKSSTTPKLTTPTSTTLTTTTKSTTPKLTTPSTPTQTATTKSTTKTSQTITTSSSTTFFIITGTTTHFPQKVNTTTPNSTTPIPTSTSTATAKSTSMTPKPPTPSSPTPTATTKSTTGTPKPTTQSSPTPTATTKSTTTTPPTPKYTTPNSPTPTTTTKSTTTPKLTTPSSPTPTATTKTTSTTIPSSAAQTTKSITTQTATTPSTPTSTITTKSTTTTTPKPTTPSTPTSTATTKSITTTPKLTTPTSPTAITTTKSTTPKLTTPSSPTTTATTKSTTTTPKHTTPSSPTPTTTTKSTSTTIPSSAAQTTKSITTQTATTPSTPTSTATTKSTTTTPKPTTPSTPSSTATTKSITTTSKLTTPTSPTAITTTKSTTPKLTTPSSPTTTATTKSTTTTPKHTTPSSPTPTTTTKSTSTTIPSSAAQTTKSITTQTATTPSTPTSTATTKSTTTTPKPTTPSTPTAITTTKSTTPKLTTPSSPTTTATTKSTTTTPKHTTPSSPTPTTTTKSTSTTIPSSAAQTTKSITTQTATTPSTPTPTATTKSTTTKPPTPKYTTPTSPTLTTITKSTTTPKLTTPSSPTPTTTTKSTTTTTPKPTTPSTPTSTATTKSITTTPKLTTPTSPTPITTTKSTTPKLTTPSSPTTTATTKSTTTTPKHTTPSSPTPTTTTKSTSTTIPSSTAQTTKSITTQTATTPSSPTSTITTKSTTTTTPKPTTPSTPTSTATTKSITTTPKLTTPTSPTPITTTKSTTPKLTTPSSPTTTATTKSTTTTPKHTTPSSPTPTTTTKSTSTTIPSSTAQTTKSITTQTATTPSTPTSTATTKSTTTTPKPTTPSTPTPTATTKSTTTTPPTPKYTTPTSPTHTTTTKSTTTPKLTTPSSPTPSSPTSTATTTTQKPTTPSTPTPTVSTKSTTTTSYPTTSSSPTPTATTTSTKTQKPTILPSPTPTTKSTTTTPKATTPSSPTSTSTTKSITTSKPTTPSSPTTTATTRSTTTTTPKPTTPSTPTLTATTKSTTTTSKPTVQSSPTPTSTIKSTITTAKPTTPSPPTTTPGHTTSTRSISTTTATPPDCPEWAKNTNETFYLCKCMMARCIKDNNIEVIPFQCPPLQNITCENGKKPVLVEDEYGCCKYYACDCFCEGWGDPHYKTFDGKFYSHQGNCTYTLMEEIRPQTHLKIYIDSVYCDLVERVSCPRSIIVSYNKLVIKLTNHNLLGGADLEAFENNVKLRLPYAYNGVRVISSSLDLFLSIPLLGVNISFGATGFGINLPFQHFGNNTQGHCGTCNNNKADDCMIPGGILVDDCAVMADYWPASGVNGEVCTPPSALPSVPVKNELPSKQCKAHPDCYLLNNELFKACHSHIPPQNFILSCQYDSCHMGNPAVVCISLQTYARACLQLGICINWRNYTKLCNIECPADKVFNPCGPAEPPTCADIPEEKNIKMRTEGCFCPEGTLLFNKNTKVCVNKCGCLDSSKIPRDFGEVFEYNCEECICEKNSKSVSCKPKACLDVSTEICTEPGFVLVNVTNPSDPCCSKQVCNCDVSMCPPMDKKCPIGHNPVVKVPDGKCCPEIKCEPKKVCVYKNMVYEPGTNIPKDGCQECRCTLDVDPKTQLFMTKCQSVKCIEKCDPGYENIKKKPDDCCGECVKTHCIVSINGVDHTLKEGETFPSTNQGCDRITCTKINGQFITNKYTVQCPPFNISNCQPGTVQLSSDGCCNVCVDQVKGCRVQTVRKYIQQKDCVSEKKMDLTFCSGDCPSFGRYSELELSSCTCCQATQTSNRTVTLGCVNGDIITHTYVNAEKCACSKANCHREDMGKTLTEDKK